MVTKILCDKCYTDVKKSPGNNYTEKLLIGGVNGYGITRQSKNYDLCGDCVAELSELHMKFLGYAKEGEGAY